ncbi:MAG TPA: PAS domain-containing protein [Chthoniobacterales bacterium]|nr:PAS domain-containing protein [Chthoniobacterales bacterium]
MLAEATNDAVRDWSLTDGSLSWPQGLESLLGYKRSAAAGEIGFWQKHLHEDDRARTAASIRDALAGDAQRWSGEYRLRHANGNYLHLLERARIVRDGNGQAVRFIGSLMDITARKQLQDQVVRSQKMEAFGQLAGGVAHDFNNFLTTILGYSDLLLHELGVKGSTAKHINEIRGAAQRASNLTTQLLAFSRKHPLEPRVVEVNSVIMNLERSLLRLLGENISVECHLHRSTQPAHIKVDPNQLTQIILNLAVNARDAMPRGGKLTLGTGAFRVDGKAHPGGCPERLAPGEYVLISLTDTGAGLSDEAKDHLFEPFFTTKEDGESSGLGLATSYGIVRQSGGQMCVESQPGRGTMITIYLPRVPAPPAPGYKKPGSKKLPTGTETILVVEDDVAVRHISVRVLRSLGYDVIEAASGDDAQRLISLDESKKIDLLLTDLVMPLMGGRDFADWMTAASPTTKVIFISGYLDQSLHVTDQQDVGMFFLPKPFDPEQLAQKVRQALDAR